MPPKTGKEALLEWCQQKTAGYAEVKIVNFHTSWRDGLGFCALLHYFAPDDVDYEKLKAEPAVLKRLEAIFDIGDDLGVANILDPEDMLIEPQPDQFSVITYLSQVFHRFKGQPRGGQQQLKRPAELDAAALRLAQQACHVCNALLTGDVIEAFGRTVHTRCFTCASCGVRLGRQFVDVDDKPYCDVCGKAAFVASVAAKQNITLSAAGAGAGAGAGDDKAALDRQLADEQRRIAEREAAAAARLTEQRDALRKREADERAKFAQAEQIVANKMKEQRDALAAKKRERLETLGHSDAPRLQSLRKPKMGGRRAPTPGVRPGAKLDTHVDAPSTRDTADDAPPAAAAAATAPSSGAPRGVVKPGGMPGNQGALAAAAASMAGSLKRGGGVAGGGGAGRGGGASTQQQQQRQAEAAKAAADERARLEAQKRRELEAARALRESKTAAELAEREARAKQELQRVAAEAKAQSEREAAARAREAAARDAEREARELAQQISKSTEERKRDVEQKRKQAEEERARELAAAQRREEAAIAARRAELERQQRDEGERRRRDEAALRAQEEERMKRDLDAAASRISELFLELGDDAAGGGGGGASEPVSDDELAGVRQADGTILLPSGVLLPALPGAGTKVRALFDYPQAQDAGELTFRRGDVVVVIERGDDGAWWSGMLGETVGLFPSNFFSARGRRICGPGDEEVNSDDDDDDDDTEDDGNTDEFEREERMLEELERKKLGELAAERTRRKEEILKAELAAERAAEEERGRLAREREQLINRMQSDWVEKKRTRTRTQTDASLGALDDKSKAAIDAQYSAKVAAAATRAAALEAGGKDGHVRTMTLSTSASGADGSAAPITVDALLQGYLNKRDGRGFGTIKKWRKRYYVLRDGQMIAYPDKPTKGMAPTGVIALEFVEKIEPSGRDAFVLHTSEKKYHLDALGDVAVAAKWIETLEAAVAAAKNPPSTRGAAAAAAPAEIEGGGATAATWQRKSGWLERHGGGAFQAQWSKVWVVMKGGVVFTFSKPGAKQQQKVSLYRAVLDEYKPHKYDGVTFMITTQNESEKKGKPAEIIFRCKNQQEMHDWLNTLLRQKLKIEESVDMIAL